MPITSDSFSIYVQTVEDYCLCTIYLLLGISLDNCSLVYSTVVTVYVALFSVFKIVLHFRKVEVCTSCSTEYVQHINARRFKVACSVIGLGNKKLKQT